MYIESQKILSANNFESILMSQKQFSPTATKQVKSFNSALTLTSLVDCFTILVVYLLLATSIGVDELKMTEKIALPLARGENDTASRLQLQVSNNGFLLDNKFVPVNQLSATLRSLRIKFDSLIILADKNQSFGKLNPVVSSGLEAGFSNIHFAVQMEEEK